MNFNQNVIDGNSQVVNQQQGLYSQAGVTGINVSPVEMPNPMSIDTLNGVSNQNLGVSVSSPLNNGGGVNGQNTSLSNANNIDNNFVMENNNQSGNSINNSNIYLYDPDTSELIRVTDPSDESCYISYINGSINKIFFEIIINRNC